VSEKKKQQAANSPVDERQIQEILGHYHQIAGTLHESQDQQQAEAALTTINAGRCTKARISSKLKRH